jgi:hypothetical protein
VFVALSIAEDVMRKIAAMAGNPAIEKWQQTTPHRPLDWIQRDATECGVMMLMYVYHIHFGISLELPFPANAYWKTARKWMLACCLHQTIVSFPTTPL